MPYMYILECADGSYYTGSTWDLERRLWQHQNGLGANHTAKRLPVKLVYCEAFNRIDDAYRREKQIQGWSRKKKQALMAGDTHLLHHLAECQNESHYRNAGAGRGSAGFGFAQPARARPSFAERIETAGKPSVLTETDAPHDVPSRNETHRSLSEVEGSNNKREEAAG
jgi:putative endonuclease